MTTLNLTMDIYTPRGVVMTISWANEAGYQRGRKFLDDMGVRCGPLSERQLGKPEFFCLETEQQLEALYEFRRALREGRA